MRILLKKLFFGPSALGFSLRGGAPSLVAMALALLLAGTAQAQWLTGYHYRKSLAIGAGVGAGTGYQIQVRVGESSGSTGYDLHLEGKARNFPNDVRFTDDNGTTNLGHWLDSTTGVAPNRTVTFLVKVNDNLDGAQSIFTYYGKIGDASGSSGDATFSFFDDFTGGTIDTAKWIIDDSTGWSIVNGELRGQNTRGRIRSQTAFNAGVVLESKFRSLTRPFNGYMPLGFYTSRTDSFGWFNNPGTDQSWSNGVGTNIGPECNAAVIARITARTNQVDLYVYRQDNGAVWHNLANQSNTVSNERIRLGTRYDNNYNAVAPGQAYDAYWDWVRVRKYSDNVPTMGAVGAEQADAPTVTLITPANGSQVGIGASPSATATVFGGTQPCTVEFFLNSVSIGTDNTEPYSINLGALAGGSYTISATVTDSFTPARTANSATHTITVATDSTPPTPSPMTFAVIPTSISPTSIRMAATTATDAASSPVQYFFENTTNSNTSGWQLSPFWTESSLTLGTPYSYRVKARDSAAVPNETAWSDPTLSATPSVIVPRAISIVNPGFENPVLTDNDSIGTFIGWTSVGGVYVWNPPASSYTQEAPEGQNVGTIFLSSAFSGCTQVLQGAHGQFQADAAYELKVRVGGGCNYAGATYAYDGYLIQLVVNGTIIAQDDNSRVPATGAFVTTSIKYNYNAAMHSGLVGYPMEIRLLTKGLGGGNGIVTFDDVQLTYASSSPLANHGGPYRLSQVDSLSLNGSASIPSPGAAITTYEWDLDSRNDHLGFIANVTGPTSGSLSYATLTSVYGMVDGINTIRLRVTDTAGQSATSIGTVAIFTVYNYTGTSSSRGQDEKWNVAGNWSATAVPAGLVDVVIPPSLSIVCNSSFTPAFTGNLSVGANSSIQLGWSTGTNDVYNGMGTPGSTVITMHSGSAFNFRVGGTPLIPAIALAGNASFTLGSSTVGGAAAHFNYPITGNYRLSFNGNGHGSCLANLNAPNTFTELYTAGGPYVDGGVTLLGNAPGAFGTGNVTLTALSGGGNSGIVVINAANAMADSAILSMDGNTALKITMNANDTISRLVINGAQMPAGTYGSSTSSATFKQTWMAGTGVLTVTDGQATYWDTNGATAGAGGAAPAGTWDTGTSSWSASSAGNTTTASWIAGGSAIFAAGSDAVNPYTVTVGESNAIRVENSFTSSANTGTSSFSTTRAAWPRNGGNCIVVMISSLNATGFTATYAGLPMTVQSINKTPVNSYAGIAYIISDSLPATGDVVISVPRVVGVGNSGGYANQGTVYSILSLSNVDTAGTAVTKLPSPVTNTSSLTYTTTVNNSFVLGIASDSDWHNKPNSVVGTCSTIISQAKPAYFNTVHCSGSVVAAGTYTDVYSLQPTALITLVFKAKLTPNPLFTSVGQKISGLTFEEGAVTISSSKLELQATSFFTSASGVTGTIASQIAGLSSSGITKKGLGAIVLSNSSNNYTGPTNIINGILRLGANNAIPNTAVTLAGDAPGLTATLDLNGFNTTVAGLTFGGSSATSGSSVIGSGTLTLSGNVTFNGDNSPLGATLASSLALGSSTRSFNIKDSSSAANDLTVSTAVSGTGGITKLGFGTLVLSGNNTYTGLTTASSGLLVLSGDNTLATGNMTVSNGGAVRFDALNSINGSGQNVTIQSGGLVSFGPSFGGANVVTALARIDTASTGVIAVDNVSSSDFNFTTNSLNAYLGALSDITYAGTITPFGATYRIGGGTGTITLSGASSLLGGNNLVVGGSVIIANTYNLGAGTTTINASGRLQIGAGGTVGSLASASLTNNGMLAFNRSDTLTQSTQLWTTIGGTGALEQAGSGTLILNGNNTYSGGTNLIAGTLNLGHTNAIGSGRLNIYSGTLDATTPLTLATNNAVTVVSSFTFGGSANLNMGTAIVSNTGNHTIQLNGSGNLTFGGMTNISGVNQTLTVDGVGKTLTLGRYNMSNNVYSSLMELTIGGTGNVTITGPVNDWTGGDPLYPPYDPFDIRLGNLIKTGPGTLTLSGNNNYTGDTVVEEGVLHLASGTQMSPIIVESGGTLAFTLGSTITSTENLTLDFLHKIRIVGTPDGRDFYTLMVATAITGGAPTLETPITIPANYYLEIAGNELRLSKSDITPPVLVDIINDQGEGASVGPIVPNTLVTYTVSFNEDILDGDVDATDFANAGNIPIGNITFGNIAEISPGVFIVEVTPTVAGTLKLRIPVAAVIRDAANNPLDNDPAIDDDTTITVGAPSNDWLVATDIEDDRAGAAVSPGTLVTYTLYFSRDINHLTVNPADFGNAGLATIAAIADEDIAEIAPGIFTVKITPTGYGSLQLHIPTTATIEDTSANSLDVVPAIEDDTTINVTHKYGAWAGDGNTFGDDLNQDGVANGLAWLLGASNPNEDARDLLPASTVISGALYLDFVTLDTAALNGASIKVEYSKDLGAWNQAEVPGAAGIYPDYLGGPIDFNVTDLGGGYLAVEAIIPASEALPGTKLFGRVDGTSPP